jgi:hypothetical protein
MRISKITPKKNYILHIVLDDGRKGIFDVNPYLKYEAFIELKKPNSFKKVSNGGYFIEWDCGADLSLDTIAHHLQYE